MDNCFTYSLQLWDRVNVVFLQLRRRIIIDFVLSLPKKPNKDIYKQMSLESFMGTGDARVEVIILLLSDKNT